MRAPLYQIICLFVFYSLLLFFIMPVRKEEGWRCEWKKCCHQIYSNLEQCCFGGGGAGLCVEVYLKLVPVLLYYRPEFSQ